MFLKILFILLSSSRPGCIAKPFKNKTFSIYYIMYLFYSGTWCVPYIMVYHNLQLLQLKNVWQRNVVVLQNIVLWRENRISPSHFFTIINVLFTIA